ncbi:MAG: response regulator transcription factor [Archangium sp.]|nr:response regulator transcription factor [Archangium sp.]
MTTRIVLADDHTLVRAGVRALLERLGGVEIVGEASDGREALELVRAHKPDLALLDIAMPNLNGLDAAERLSRESPRTKVVILSTHANEAYVVHALKSGVAGYMLKDACVEELPLMLRAVAKGQVYLSAGISTQVVEAMRQRADGEAPGSAVDPLTPRQREILQLVAEGKTTKDIAALLGLSVKTVDVHRGQIMERLDLHDVAALVRYAVRIGLVSSER